MSKPGNSEIKKINEDDRTRSHKLLCWIYLQFHLFCVGKILFYLGMFFVMSVSKTYLGAFFSYSARVTVSRSFMSQAFVRSRCSLQNVMCR